MGTLESKFANFGRDIDFNDVKDLRRVYGFMSRHLSTSEPSVTRLEALRSVFDIFVPEDASRERLVGIVRGMSMVVGVAMHCDSAYPLLVSDINMMMIIGLERILKDYHDEDL